MKTITYDFINDVIEDIVKKLSAIIENGETCDLIVTPFLPTNESGKLAEELVKRFGKDKVLECINIVGAPKLHGKSIFEINVEQAHEYHTDSNPDTYAERRKQKVWEELDNIEIEGEVK